ncbi:MAG: MFS transporter [Bacteroidales bacterium]
MHPDIFRPGIPYWCRFVSVIILLITTLTLNGAYTGSSIDISGSLSVLKEDISMAYYATTAGMIATYPMAAKVRSILSTKSILLIDLFVQFFLSLVCLNSNNIYIIIITSFFIGFLKAFMMLELIVLIRPFLSPKNIRSNFYSYFYPLVYGFSQLSLLVTSVIAYNFQWQYMYYIAIIMLLVSISLILVTMRFEKKVIRIPFKSVDWRSLLYMDFILLMIIYVCIYGKVDDWFSSTFIVGACVLVPIVLFLFFYHEKNRQQPYIDLSVLKFRKPLVSYIFMFIAMFIISSNTLINNYATTIIGVNNVKSNALNLFTIPGFVVGGIICYWWFKLQIFRFRTLIFWGMASLNIYLALIYLGITPTGTYEYLFLPMFFRGIGMIIIFIAFGVYAVEDLPVKYTVHNAFFIVCMRSTLAPVVASSFYTNMLYRKQTEHTQYLGEYIMQTSGDTMNIFQSNFNNAINNGNSYDEALIVATKKLYALVAPQASLVAMKELLGWTLIISIIIMIIARFTPFHRTVKVKQVQAGDDMV